MSERGKLEFRKTVDARYFVKTTTTFGVDSEYRKEERLISLVTVLPPDKMHLFLRVCLPRRSLCTSTAGTSVSVWRNEFGELSPRWDGFLFPVFISSLKLLCNHFNKFWQANDWQSFGFKWFFLITIFEIYIMLETTVNTVFHLLFYIPFVLWKFLCCDSFILHQKTFPFFHHFWNVRALIVTRDCN